MTPFAIWFQKKRWPFGCFIKSTWRHPAITGWTLFPIMRNTSDISFFTMFFPSGLFDNFRMFFSGIRCPSFFNFFRQRFSICASTFLGHISKILFLGSKIQMFWITTRSIVTFMANIFSIGNFTISKFIHKTMNIFCCVFTVNFSNISFAIPGWICGSLPKPTIIRRFFNSVENLLFNFIHNINYIRFGIICK